MFFKVLDLIQVIFWNILQQKNPQFKEQDMFLHIRRYKLNFQSSTGSPTCRQRRFDVWFERRRSRMSGRWWYGRGRGRPRHELVRDRQVPRVQLPLPQLWRPAHATPGKHLIVSTIHLKKEILSQLTYFSIFPMQPARPYFDFETPLLDC